MQLFNERQEAFVNLEVVQKLAAIHGPVRCDGGEFVFQNGKKASKEEIDNIRKLAIADINRNDVQTEKVRRIFVVVRDTQAQINLLLWLSGPEQKTEDDMKMAGQIIEWIMATNKASKQLAAEPNYRDDKFWPQVPAGAAKFMERFQ